MVTSHAATQNDSFLIQFGLVISVGGLGAAGSVSKGSGVAPPGPPSSRICQYLGHSAGACRIIEPCIAPYRSDAPVSRDVTLVQVKGPCPNPSWSFWPGETVAECLDLDLRRIGPSTARWRPK
jgi:hypothetical protein